MTPSARAAAAIEVLDTILGGQPAELALTHWGRGHRFAGSGDRLAIRDLVFAALRCARSAAARGGSDTGRGIILGLLRERGDAALFSGIGHAPAPATPAEAGRPPDPGPEALDCPDWLAPRLQAALGDDFAAVMQALRLRAPVFVRANLARTTPALAQQALAQDGIAASAVPNSKTALQVTENERKIQTSTAYLQGLVELQDLSSQSLCAALPLRPGQSVLDYCAGGGGKSLAMAALARLHLFAHDAAPQRMKDLGPRAARAGTPVTVTADPAARAPYDLILCDVPCSGSGSWRRDPAGKWALTPDRLASLCTTQAAILDHVAPWVAPAGHLAYATCSLLADENEAQIAAFLTRHPDWTCRRDERWSPTSGGDGFYLALLCRSSAGALQP